MDKLSDGGPAFPGGCLPEHPHTPNGMSLRDWFAGQALIGLLSNPSDQCFDDVVENAWRYADAMLADREVRS